GKPRSTGHNGFTGGTTYAQLLTENVVGPPVGVMFQRTALVEAGGFEQGLQGVEDYELYLRLARDHESFCHGKLIAEYRQHDANMSSNHEGMLRGMLATLDRQDRWIGNDSVLRQALARGRRNAHEQYDWEPRMERLRSHLRARQWLRATACA